MRFFWLFCALGALFGCRTVSEPSGTAIALFCSTSEQSKTDILTQDDEIAVFACPEGTESYFLEAAKFIVDADGRSLTYGSTVYYPDPKEAVRFFAYFPYHKGTFSVPTDQSTAKALKEADLCGAVASSTPVATPVALEFRHLMARVVVITTNEPTEKISFPNAVASGVLHAATAELVLADTRSEVWTDKNELIVPVQPLTRLVLTVAGVEYVFDGSVALEVGKTTSLNLTLHPDTHTATLSGSSVTDWELAKTEGSPSQAVSNALLLHWPSLPQGATPDRVVFTIGGTDYTVSNGITYANHTFTVPFTSSVLRYPYTISNITFYQSNRLVQSCANLIGATSYKSGTMTVGINPSAIRIGDLIWATGNLVASNATAGARGEGGCRIGAPADGGLYFQFGSLIGWKGGSQINDGTGVGTPDAAWNNKFWNGAAVWSWDNEAMVWPDVMTKTPSTWPCKDATNISTLSDYYFNYSLTPWNTTSLIDIGMFTVTVSGQGFPSGNLRGGRYANLGVGDPCTYYLGGTWRLPTSAEQASITGKAGSGWSLWITAGVTGRWATANQTFAGVSGPGAWFGTGLNAGIGTPTLVNPFFPASGPRNYPDGSSNYVTVYGFGWSSSVANAAEGYSLDVEESRGVQPQDYSYRSFGFPVRCVSDM